MVEVFRTNITDEQAAALILERFQNEIPGAKINFDLEDCDNILRVESDTIAVKSITELVRQHGFYCEALE
jgi:hypothetical protein